MAQSIKDYLNRGLAKVQESPIRIGIKKNSGLPIENVKEELNRIENDFQVLINKVEKPLNVVLMGEVKAGKSTLLNALAGGKVSPVNVTETTASIIEVFHSETERGIIQKYNGEKIEGNTNDIFEVLEKHHGDKEFFSTVEVVKLGFPLKNLKKLRIVDTPGLATITKENEEKTKKYLQEADVILWVLNANYLGQTDIEESMSHVAKSGKKILGVINHIDEIESNPRRIVRYVKQKMGIYFEEIFPMSALDAFNGITNNDDMLLEISGYDKLFDYLENNIEANSEEVHTESIISSAKALISNDLSLHESYLRNIAFLVEQMENNESKLEYHKRRILGEVKDRIEEHFNDFLEEEKAQIEHELNNTGNNLIGGFNRINAERIVGKAISQEKMNQDLKNIITDVNEYFRSEWKAAMIDIQKELRENTENFIKEEESNFVIEFNTEMAEMGTAVKEGAVSGALMAGTWGTAIAAYTAWLGPYAASVTLGAAVSAILPPVLLAGAATGIVAKFVGNKKDKSNLLMAIDKRIDDTKNKIKANMLKNKLEELSKTSEEICDNAIDSFVENYCPGWKKEDLLNHKSEIKIYCDNLKNSEFLKQNLLIETTETAM